jgi:hypothetical protein
VLLVHGASARAETFEIPGPDSKGEPRCLMDWLHSKNYEPWLLDWRGSGRVVDEALKDGTLKRHRHLFNFDEAARWDIPGALDRILEVRRKEGSDAESIGAVAHCMGAGTLAQAIADGYVKKEHRLSHVVLSTLGLFYQVHLESRLKTQDHLLERLLRNSPKVLAIDPQKPKSWPAEFRGMYDNWPTSLRPHQEANPSPVHDLCNRLSFMYGSPYHEHNLVPEIHSTIWTVPFSHGEYAPVVGDAVTGELSAARGVLHDIEVEPGSSWQQKNAKGVLILTRPEGEFQDGEPLQIRDRRFAAAKLPTRAPVELPRQFGAIPLKMYAHGARNARRRWAATYPRSGKGRSLVDQKYRKRFEWLERLTLITGQKNQLWHRDSIDRMFAWLTRGTSRPGDRYHRVILPEYGHQDLFWGINAREDVFEKIRMWLPGNGGGNGAGLRDAPHRDKGSGIRRGSTRRRQP